jgi:hypothetical protein
MEDVIPRTLADNTFASLISNEEGLLFEIAITKHLEQLEKNVLDVNISKGHYISNINAVKNPDVLFGGKQGFLKGNKYFGYIRADDTATGLEEEKGELRDFDLDSEDVDFKDGCKRFFQIDNKSIRCNNCQEIGHIMSQCPNERKVNSC